MTRKLPRTDPRRPARCDLSLFNRDPGRGFEFWSGYISAVVVYDRALSASEVQQDVAYLQGQSVPEPTSMIMGGMGFIFAVVIEGEEP